MTTLKKGPFKSIPNEKVLQVTTTSDEIERLEADCAELRKWIGELEQIIRESSDRELETALEKLKRDSKVDPAVLNAPADAGEEG